MKILEIIPTLSVGGGAESFVLYLTQEFVKQGHECCLLTLFDINPEVVKKLGIPADIERHQLGKKHGLDLICFAKVYLFIKDYKPDVVHVHVGAIPYISLAATIYRKCKYFATIHSEARREAGNSFMKYSRFYLFKRKLIEPITISEESQKSFEAFYHLPSTLIYNGVPSYNGIIIKKPNQNGLIKFIHVARCHPIKNQQLLLMAFSYLAKKYRNIELDWYGDKDGNEELFNSLKMYFSNQIFYKGESSNVREHMSSSDAFCLSSIMEGMPMTVLEAMSVGCIPISTPVGGCVNIIKDGVNGYLAEGMTVDSYIVALEKFILLDQQKKKDMQEAAIKSYKDNYSISICGSFYQKVFLSNIIH